MAGELTGGNPVDRGKPGSQYYLLIDTGGLPLAVGLSAANAQDSHLLEQLVDAVPVVIGPRGRLGRPRWRPARLHAEIRLRPPHLLAGAPPAPRHLPVGRAARGGVLVSGWAPPSLEGGAVAGLAAGQPRLMVRYKRRADILTAFLCT